MNFSPLLFYFNPRSREGSDNGVNYISGMISDFNPRSREGSDESETPQQERDMLYFNPRSREGSDGDTDYICFCSRISIHAPAKGATFIAFAVVFSVVLFQSTLPRRERRWWMTLLHRRADFNPRSREGSDYTGVSSLIGNRNFNPRSREGSDLPLVLPLIFTFNFNPRSREGSDKGAVLFVCAKARFQSTLPRRERLRAHQKSSQMTTISIHAPTKGATCNGT